MFSSSEHQIFIRENTIQTGVPHINLGILRSIPVQRPPLAEQEAIAEALSDADAHLESLEQLIAEKRQIDGGAMQELLTGKKRLPGFSGEWEVKRLDAGWLKYAAAAHRAPTDLNSGEWRNSVVHPDRHSLRLTSSNTCRRQARTITTQGLKSKVRQS